MPWCNITNRPVPDRPRVGVGWEPCSGLTHAWVVHAGAPGSSLRGAQGSPGADLVAPGFPPALPSPDEEATPEATFSERVTVQWLPTEELLCTPSGKFPSIKHRT